MKRNCEIHSTKWKNSDQFKYLLTYVYGKIAYIDNPRRGLLMNFRADPCEQIDEDRVLAYSSANMKREAKWSASCLS